MKLTPQSIEQHILGLIEARLPTQHLATEEFNKGIKFATDYVLEFIRVVRKPTKWQLFIRRFGFGKKV